MEDLKVRVKRYVDELGIMVTKMCDRMHIGHSTYYAWMSGRLELSPETEERIDAYIRGYGF